MISQSKYINHYFQFKLFSKSFTNYHTILNIIIYKYIFLFIYKPLGEAPNYNISK